MSGGGSPNWMGGVDGRKLAPGSRQRRLPGSVEAWDGRMDGAGRAVSSKKLCEQEP